MSLTIREHHPFCLETQRSSLKVDILFTHSDDAICSLFHQISIMGHENNGALKILNSFTQRRDTLKIQVVGRLIENQHVVFKEHQFGKEQARGFATR